MSEVNLGPTIKYDPKDPELLKALMKMYHVACGLLDYEANPLWENNMRTAREAVEEHVEILHLPSSKEE